jgi:ribosomal protein L11 methyltransferase
VAWLNLRFTVGAEMAEALADTLSDLGALSVSIDDAAAGTPNEQPIFGEPGMPEEALWALCSVSALFAHGTDAAVVASKVATSMGLDKLPQVQSETVEEADWVRLTQAQFDPIRISDRLWIVPTWHKAPDPTAINIALDPGVAFGTGSHPTTRLCLKWLEEHIQGGESVLDYGCGSGILAIAAAKLGAASVMGIDIDTQAVQAARQNAEQNGVEVSFSLPDRAVPTPMQVTVANILSTPLKLLAPLLAECTAPGGQIVLSGILGPQAGEVMACYEPWFTMAIYAEDSGWVCLAGRKYQA